MRKIGPIIAICSGIGMILFIAHFYPQPGYTQSDRAFMDSLISGTYISDEYHARVVDIQANLTPLSVEDLR